MLLNHHLRYNIADLDDPDVRNSEAMNLDDKIVQGICHGDPTLGLALPQALSYAARYWPTHIASTSTMDLDLLKTLSSFCDNHLLHWIELLSLTESLAYTTQSNLLAVIRWSEVRGFGAAS
jgi:hypothetical protein